MRTLPREVHLAALLVAALTLAAPAAAKKPPSPAQLGGRVAALFYLHHPAGLDHFARAVSDPGSPSYRSYASVEQLVRRFGGRRTAIHRTQRWLRERGLRGELSPTREYLTALLPARRARRIFGVAATSSAGSAAEPPVPSGLRGAVSEVGYLGTTPLPGAGPPDQPTIERTNVDGLPGSAFLRSGHAKGCAAGRDVGISFSGKTRPTPGFTPNQYLTAYGQRSLHRRGLRGGGVRVALVEIDGYGRPELRRFAHCFGVPVPRTHRHTVGLPKPYPASQGAETPLDLEVLAAGAPRLSGISVYEARPSAYGTFRGIAAALGPRGRHPDVISNSVGICEVGAGLTPASTRAFNNTLALAAGAGISFLSASGDNGAADCPSRDGTSLPFPAVDFPASSPWATAVGGTNLKLTKDNRISKEVVWNDESLAFAAGGGGFSILGPQRRPWWQANVTGPSFSSARVVPDVSALADVLPGLTIFANGRFYPIGGTSAAAPLVASGIALADQRARQGGQADLGFLNPLIYRLGARSPRRVFRDVKAGDNDVGPYIPAEAGGGLPLGCCSAARGYDNASGWGSIKFGAFVNAAARAGR